MKKGLLYACLAGFWACMAAVFGKLSMEGGTTIISFLSPYYDLSSSSQANVWIVRGMTFLSFGLIFASNALMLNAQVKALDDMPSPHAVAATTSINLLFSSIMSSLIFGEPISMTWALGTTLIVVGLYLMNKKPPEKEEKPKKE